ncbi:MAG: HisA/HisF-related TIM barrel protein [Paludibaculum sp.]
MSRPSARADQLPSCSGFETIQGPAVLSESAESLGAERVLFSLDLKSGTPLASAEWPTSAFDIARIAVEAGTRQMIVLDLADVGTASGASTMPLCWAIRCAFPALRLITGGGLRSRDDVRSMIAGGIDAVLVASALHDGAISR